MLHRPLAFLSGPSFAAGSPPSLLTLRAYCSFPVEFKFRTTSCGFFAEIVQGMATAVTVASTDRDLANDLMALFTSASFRALYTPDVVGVEVRGSRQ
jgi:hypothetical protein